MTKRRLGATIGAGFGLVITISAVVWIRTMGAWPVSGEPLALLLTSSMYLGFPLSAGIQLVSVLLALLLMDNFAFAPFIYGLMYGVMVVGIIVNWMLIGAAIGALLDRLRHRGHRRPVKGARH